MLQNLYLGSSIAISWAWGTSLILGMQIAQTKGLPTFTIWAIANTLTLVLFGYLYRTKKLNPLVLNLPIVKYCMLLIQAFCLLIQMKILSEYLGEFTSYNREIAICFGLSLIILMYAKGLSASIFTDSIQGSITLICLVSIILISTQLDSVVEYKLTSSGSDLLWGCWSACILLSGIITDLQHWQRAEVNEHKYAFEYAAVLFFIYLVLVYLTSLFKLDTLVKPILLFTVLCITTSTIDSIAVAFHKIGKNVGTVICSLLCIFSFLLADIGVISLWSYFGIIRITLALYIIYWCYKENKYGTNCS